MKKVLIRGPLLSRSGYGEHARYMFRAISSRPDLFDVYALPLGWGQSSWTHQETEENKKITECINKTQTCGAFNQNGLDTTFFDISLQVGIPHEWNKLAKYNIGVTAAVETTQASGKWIDSCNKLVDRIFVTSEHAKNSLTNPVYDLVNEAGQSVGKMKCNTPIDVISYPVRKTKPDKKFQKKIKLDTDFNFLTMAQFGPRKNLENSIFWFLEEFRDNPDVGLIVKTHQMNNSGIDRAQVCSVIKRACDAVPNRKCKVYLIHGNLTDEEISSFYTHPKIHAYMTATHGEGFGLPIFEAAHNGMPVVAPAWSGHIDFLYADVENEVSKRVKKQPMFTKVKYELNEVQEAAVWDDIVIKGSKWCFPDGADFRKSLRKTYDVYLPKKRQAERLAEFLADKLEENKMFETVVECVTKVLPEDMGELEDWFEQFSDSVVVSE